MTGKVRPSGDSASDYFAIFDCICEALPGPRRDQIKVDFAKAMESTGDFYCAFVEVFDGLAPEAERVLFWLDWKDAKGFDWQLDAIAALRGFDRTKFPRYQAGDSVDQRFADLDIWLRSIGYALVEWDTGGDEYISWITPDSRLDVIPDISPLTMNLKVKIALYSKQSIDLSPSGVTKNMNYQSTVFSNCTFFHSEMVPFRIVDCRFINCTFQLRKNGRAFHFEDSTFEHCTMEFEDAHQYMFDHQNSFAGCVFTGSLSNARICNSPYAYDFKGELKDCDFRNLYIHDVEFRGMCVSERQKLHFPDWPIIRMDYGTRLEPNIDFQALPRHFRDHNTRVENSENYMEGYMVTDLSKVVENPEDFWAVAFDANFLHFAGKDARALPDPQETSRLRAYNLRCAKVESKYRSAFWLALSAGFKIEGATKEGKDILLETTVKHLKETNSPGTRRLRLSECTLAEFRGGTEDGDLVVRKTPFTITRGVIDEEADMVTLIGARKAYSKLHLTFSSWSEET